MWYVVLVSTTPNTSHLPGHLRRSIPATAGTEVQIRNVEKRDGFGGRRWLVIITNGRRWVILGTFTYGRKAEADRLAGEIVAQAARRR